MGSSQLVYGLRPFRKNESLARISKLAVLCKQEKQRAFSSDVAEVGAVECLTFSVFLQGVDREGCSRMDFIR